MKNNILLIISLFVSFVNAQVTKTVNVTTAGTLRTLFTTTEMTTVTNLAVTGSIDARDFKFMRDGITQLAVLDISGVTIQAYNGASGTSNATSYPSNELPEQSFYKITRLIAITIPNSVTSIGSFAFDFCSGLTSITIPNSVSLIGNSAFGGCSGLTSLSIGNSVTAIGNSAFGSCTSLTNLTIGNSVITIGWWAFYGCSSLRSIIIPNSVTTIGMWAFDSCSKLTSIMIGDSVKFIEDYAFENCTSLTNLTIGNSVTLIAYHAFLGCSSLTSLSIPNSVTSIENQAFYGCTGLSSIYSYATTPVVLSTGVFTSVNVYTCTLYVPAGSKSAYQEAPIWGDFNIVEMAPSALPVLISESINIYPNPVTDGFYLNGLEGSNSLTLTDLSGKVLIKKQVKTNDYVSMGFLPKGVYVIRLITTNGAIERKVLKK